MYADTLGGKVVSIDRGSAKPTRTPRGEWLRIVDSITDHDPITEVLIGPFSNVSSNVVYLTYTVTAHPHAVDRLAADLTRKAEKLMADKSDEVTKGYTRAEIVTWAQQKAETDAYGLDVAAATPMIDSMVSKRGLSKSDVVNRISTNAALFAGTVGALLGRLQHLRDLINAGDLVELRRIERDELTTGWD